MSKMIGVDVGGTFTDVFVLDEATGTADVAKVPTTRPDQSGGFLDGIGQQVNDLSTVAAVVHGTTAGTNALLERKGAKIGVITTHGLRDVLEMRRRDRPRTWGLRGDFAPVVPRNLRLEVPERTLADGTIRTPVDLDAVRSAAQQLIDEGCLAVAILFANAYANAENEAKAVAARADAAVWQSMSSFMKNKCKEAAALEAKDKEAGRAAWIELDKQVPGARLAYVDSSDVDAANGFECFCGGYLDAADCEVFGG